jgi:RNA polymerase sigma factor (sigma-70 family)
MHTPEEKGPSEGLSRLYAIVFTPALTVLEGQYPQFCITGPAPLPQVGFYRKLCAHFGISIHHFEWVLTGRRFENEWDYSRAIAKRLEADFHALFPPNLYPWLHEQKIPPLEFHHRFSGACDVIEEETNGATRPLSHGRKNTLGKEFSSAHEDFQAGKNVERFRRACVRLIKSIAMEHGITRRLVPDLREEGLAAVAEVLAEEQEGKTPARSLTTRVRQRMLEALQARANAEMQERSMTNVSLETAAVHLPHTASDEPDTVALRDAVPDARSSPSARLDRELWQTMLEEGLQSVLGTISPSRRQVITLLFGLFGNPPCTREEIALQMDRTEEWVRRTAEEAIENLEHPVRLRKLREFVDKRKTGRP